VKRAAGIAILVFAIPMLQGALAPFFPAALRPDLALLVVFGLSLCWRNTATGLVLAACCGFVVDLFSAGLLGQHALLSVVVFGASRLLSVHMTMAGTFARMLFAAALTVGHAFGLAALTAFFTPGAGFGLLRPSYLGPHVLANALVAPIVTGMVAGVAGWIVGEDTGSHRTLRIETRRWVA
jgi:rod shape-determining protein MreD